MFRGKDFELDVREQFIISKALFVAVRALDKEEFPPHSDIACMEKLLETKFPSAEVMDQVNKNTAKLLVNTGWDQEECGTIE